MVKKKSDKRVIILTIVVIIGALFLINVISNAIGNFETAKTKRVSVINVYGEISGQKVGGLFSVGQSSHDLVKRINEANQDSSIDAVLFRIDSPGGTPVASHEIVRAIKALDKPSAAVIRDVGASGAYWVASATDFVVSDELSLTGSVGVLGGFFDIHEFLERYNISYERFTGGEYKDLGSPFREITEVERELLQTKIDMMHDFFLEDVRQLRNLDERQFEEVRTGIYFIGLEAINLGLVDQLGNEDFAVSWLEEELEGNVRLIERQERTSLFGTLAGMSLNPFSQSFIMLR